MIETNATSEYCCTCQSWHGIIGAVKKYSDFSWVGILGKGTRYESESWNVGAFYVLFGFLSLMIQAKLPYMIPEGGWGMALLQDFGAIRIAAARNVAELQSHVQTAAVVAASVASGTPPSVKLDSGNARQIVRESDAVKL